MIKNSELLDRYLREVVERKGSDLHLQTNSPAAIRILGEVVFLDEPPLDHKQMEDMVNEVLDEASQETLFSTGSVDFAYVIEDLARFRANFLLQHYGYGAVLRVIPSKIPTMEELNLPDVLREVCDYKKGLVIVTGPTGSGKSTTLAAMINFINDNRAVHMITIEDPIEFAHPSKKSMIQQRQVGVHAKSFNQALRAALRESPDIVLVGEMRDLETISEAISAAETGHLVFGTLHTNSASKTVDRIIDVFPAAEKDMVRAMLSESIVAVISQTLLKTKDGQGRVAAHEIMVGSPAIRNLIRENKVAQMYSAIQTSQAAGMQTLDQCLVELVRRNQVSAAEARARAVNKDLFGG